jgi:hypothetical protein
MMQTARGLFIAGLAVVIGCTRDVPQEPSIQRSMVDAPSFLPEEHGIVAQLKAMGYEIEQDGHDWGFYNLDDDALRLAAQLRSIQFLDLFDGNVSDAGLSHLAGHTSLKVLRLGPDITDDGLAHLVFQ